MPTHVCLVRRQPLANLIGVLALRPTEVVFLTTDEPAQEEVLKLETLRELAGGAFARAVLVAGSRITHRLKARCGRLAIRYVDANDLHRLGELARQVIGI